MKSFSSPVENFKESIFATMSKLALDHKAINLSQGFPDFEAPSWIIDKAFLAMKENHNQYAPLAGILSLRQELSKHFKNSYDIEYDPHQEITITNGATEGIFSSLMALLNPGDEVIIFEPFYDSYLATIELCRAKPVPVTLQSPHFNFDPSELESAFSNKTKCIILNSPHNPSGKVFNLDELQMIAKLAIKNDCYVISDEVYEFLTFDSKKHIPIASLEGMKERTITISSVGKTFSLTGWKVGWCASSEKITHHIRMVHQYNTFSVSHPFQHAATYALQNIHKYLPDFMDSYKTKRDILLNGLKEAGLKPITPEGTFFILCELDEEDDIAYCQNLIKTKRVATIPTSIFHLKSHQGKKLIRFCFAKKEKTLVEAIDLLNAHC
ncbi:MAG: aminotransferase class I/II-fold pyridoxal phosphate-dependent enzyme [Bdellovibrionales bacterium]|nr:aminotransferase class I/II-fold pyridoxal phosphate-dependent enzyme [Bdellovibrionales bacterium]